MSAIDHGTRTGYKAGCRCDQCKCAERTYQQELRLRKQESGSAFANPKAGKVKLTAVPDNPRLTCGNAALDTANIMESAGGSAEEQVSAAIRTLDNPRPELVAVAVAMSRILDDPKAVSSKAPAAGRLIDAMERLRKGADGKRSKLSSVRSMTSAKSQQS